MGNCMGFEVWTEGLGRWNSKAFVSVWRFRWNTVSVSAVDENNPSTETGMVMSEPFIIFDMSDCCCCFELRLYLFGFTRKLAHLFENLLSNYQRDICGSEV